MTWGSVRNRAIGGVCTLSVLFSAPSPGQTPEVEAKASQGQTPIEVFSSPRPKSIDQPAFPENEGFHRREGWVQLGFMVDPTGKPFEVTVIRSTGNKTFEKVATEAIERSTFEPGSLNGKPVESGYEMKYRFAFYEHSTGADSSFVGAYRSLTDAIHEDNRVAADAAMKRLKITNLYEDTFFGLAIYRYAAKWGDEAQQLEGLRRAIAEEDYARYLPSDVFAWALLACFRLEVQTHQYAEALSTWKRLQKSRIDPRSAAQIQDIVQQLEKLRSSDTSYTVSGQMVEGSWHLHLFKPHFRAVVSEGYISQVKLRCDKRYLYFAFDPALEYQITDKEGRCSIELDGAPGTRFDFIQF
jgi:TonB family protein